MNAKNATAARLAARIAASVLAPLLVTTIVGCMPLGPQAGPAEPPVDPIPPEKSVTVVLHFPDRTGRWLEMESRPVSANRRHEEIALAEWVSGPRSPTLGQFLPAGTTSRSGCRAGHGAGRGAG